MSLNNWEIPFKNTSGETIPPFAVLRITGSQTIGGRAILEAQKPNTYGSQWSHYLNGPMEVENTKFGSCTNIFPALADFGTGSIAQGELWGPRNNSWLLQENTGGFRIIDAAPDSGLAIVDRHPMMVFYGKFTGSVSKGSTGTVTVYWGGSSTSQTISSVYAVSGAFTTSDYVNVYRINDRWEAYVREC